MHNFGLGVSRFIFLPVAVPAMVLRSCSRLITHTCTPTLFIVLSVAALLLPVNGFVFPRSSASVSVSSENILQLSAKANGDGDTSDESLYEDLRNRIQALGLDGESSDVGGGGALSGKPFAIAKAQRQMRRRNTCTLAGNDSIYHHKHRRHLGQPQC